MQSSKCISQTVYKQHIMYDLQKHVSYSKSFVHLRRKYWCQWALSVPSEWQILVSLDSCQYNCLLYKLWLHFNVKYWIYYCMWNIDCKILETIYIYAFTLGLLANYSTMSLRNRKVYTKWNIKSATLAFTFTKWMWKWRDIQGQIW